MDFIKILRDECRRIIFINDLNYIDLDNGYSLISSYTANSWLIEDTDKVKRIFEISRKGSFLSLDDCLELGSELMNSLYEEGMVGISGQEELFSDMFDFNIPDVHGK